ncbi:MAG: hypothetical protein ACI9H8_001698 [Lysobacterales bacterium]|jgi:hypothetical protein
MDLLMKIDLHKIKAVFLIITSIVIAPGFAQETDSDKEEKPQSGTASSETEVSEDNYRRFMELKDQPGERSLPTAAFVKPPSLEKMQALPESSQKHLRNELREVILQGGQWSPEQVEIEYPYNPSEAALKDQGLQDQESEAWDELVSEYHEREADIHAHSARAQAASMTGDSGEGNTGKRSAGQGQQGQDGSNDSGQMGENSEGSEGQQSASAAARSAANSAENTNESANIVESKGVSQNAFEFLQGLGTSAGTPEEHQYLNGKQLRKLLVGNTSTGTYPVDGVPVRWHDFTAPNGNLYWIDEYENQFDGTWDISENGCNFLDFSDTDEGDGCYYYIDNGDGSFTVIRPSSDVPGLQTILKGNPQKLKALQ